MTDRYFLLGENVSRSPSPEMINAAFGAMGLDAVYQASTVRAADLAASFAKLTEAKASGLNVTIPHKTAVARLLGSLDEVSSRIGAVNTVKHEGDSYRGYNTDVDGILGPLRSRGITKPRRVFVIGTGGAARAFCEAMHEAGCKELVALSRDPRRADGFLSSMKTAFAEMKIAVVPSENPPSEAPELLFNASPAGANGIPLPRHMTQLLDGRPTVFDAVYSPVRTDLIKTAEESHCRVIRGHEMLLAQAARALEIWTGRVPPIKVMQSALFESLGVVPD